MFLTLKCVFILIMSVTSKCFRSCFFSLFDRQNMKHCVYAVGGKIHKVKIPCLQTTQCSSEFQFSDATFPSILQLLLIFFGTGLEVLRAMRIDSLNLNILHFPCIISLFNIIQLHVLGNNCMLLLCILYFMWLFLHLRIYKALK